MMSDERKKCALSERLHASWRNDRAERGIATNYRKILRELSKCGADADGRAKPKKTITLAAYRSEHASGRLSGIAHSLLCKTRSQARRSDGDEPIGQPPAMAPRIMSGSRAATTASGSGVSGGRWERSSSQAK